jgi:hypothetical protein
MKRMAIEELANKIEILVKTAPKERVLLTRNGEPFAFVSDATKYDCEDIGYMNDPSFWKMIQERGKGKLIPLEVVEAEIAQREKAARRAHAPTKPQK